jgi:hypothetical protein
MRLCECGCGQQTLLSKVNDPKYGAVKGQPNRFLKGHAVRTRGVPACGYTVDSETGCWVWGLRINADGYGEAWSNGAMRKAHRAIYEEHRGEVPEGLHLDHLCRNRACVNPDHLEPVTPQINARRSTATRLSALDVIGIRFDPAPLEQVAVTYGVTVDYARDIRNRRRDCWRDL